jgi:hypothetical protein
VIGFFMFYGQCNKAIEGSVEKRTVEVEFIQTCTITLKKERANCSTISFRVTYTLPGYGL